MLLLLIESLYPENSPNSNVGWMESLLKSSLSDVDESSTWKLRQKLTNMEPKFGKIHSFPKWPIELLQFSFEGVKLSVAPTLSLFFDWE